MPLQSLWFSGNDRLQLCLVSDPDHIRLGDHGMHVLLIQEALMMLDDASIDSSELASLLYGKSTAAATLFYKSKRNIVNRAYQTTADHEHQERRHRSGRRCPCRPLRPRQTAHPVEGRIEKGSFMG